MKIFTKLLLLALVAGLAAPFFLKGPNGLPLLNYKDFIPTPDSVMNSITPKAETKLYKWKDAKGHWQFGDNPPEGVGASTMQVKTQINSMKTIELPEGFKNNTGTEPEKGFDPLSSGASPLSTAPIDKVPEMMDRIESYQQKLDDRAKTLDAL
jgi:hypothetical protein